MKNTSSFNEIKLNKSKGKLITLIFIFCLFFMANSYSIPEPGSYLDQETLLINGVATDFLTEPPAQINIEPNHPRIMINSDDLPELRTKLADPIYANDMANALSQANDDNYLTAALLYLVNNDISMANSARDSLISGAYRNAFAPIGGEAGAYYIGPVIAFDWIFDTLTPSERITIYNELRSNFNYDHTVGDSHSEYQWYWNDVWARQVQIMYPILALAIYGEGIDDAWAQDVINTALSSDPNVHGPYATSTNSGFLDVLNSQSLDSGGSEQVGRSEYLGDGYMSMWGYSQYPLSFWDSALAGESMWDKTTYFQRMPHFFAYHDMGPDTLDYSDKLEFITGVYRDIDPDMSALAKWFLDRHGRASINRNLALRLVHGDLRVQAQSPEQLGLPTTQYLRGADFFSSRDQWGDNHVAISAYATYLDTSRFEPMSGVYGIYKDYQPILMRGFAGKEGVSIRTHSGVRFYTSSEGNIPIEYNYWNSNRPNEGGTMVAEGAAYLENRIDSWESTSSYRAMTQDFGPAFEDSRITTARQTIIHIPDGQRNFFVIYHYTDADTSLSVAPQFRLVETPTINGNIITLNEATVTSFASEPFVLNWMGGLNNEMLDPNGNWEGNGRAGFTAGYSSDPWYLNRLGLGNVYLQPSQSSQTYDFVSVVEVSDLSPVTVTRINDRTVNFDGWEVSFTPSGGYTVTEDGNPPQDTTPPFLSSGSPSGNLSDGTTSTVISLNSNENANCRYSTSPGTSYSSMSNTFSSTGGTSHSTTVSGLSDGNSYSYYVRCEDTSANTNENTNDYAISFSIDIPSTPAVCGNGIIEAGEQCDGSNLNSQTCVTQGFDSGTLSCSASCTFVTSACMNNPDAPTVSINLNPSTITEGASSTLTWTSTNSNSCTLSWSGSTSTSGSEIVSPTSTTVYTATCSGTGGSAQDQATLTVNPPGGGGDGYSMRFYGNSDNNIDRVQIPIEPHTPADIGSEDFTFEFWMKANDNDNPESINCNAYDNYWTGGNIIFDRDRWGERRAYGIVTSGNVMAFGIDAPTYEYTMCGSTNVEDGQWHHIAIQRRISDGHAWIFVDGQLDVDFAAPGGDISYPDGAPFSDRCPGGSCAYSEPYITIAAEKHNVQTNGYNGMIDELRISNTLRYPTDGSGFTVQSSPFTADSFTELLYHFDEQSGSSVTDFSGNGITGDVLYGSAGGTPGPVWVQDSPFDSSPPGDTTPPVLSLGSPSGTLSDGTTSTTLSVSTNEDSTCRYSTSSGTSYGSMSNTFTTTGAQSHSTTVNGLSDGNTYMYYIRCEDGSGNSNNNDYVINFDIATPADTTPPTLSNGAPSGTLSDGTTSTTLSVSTNEASTCRYSTQSGIPYSSMTNTFTTTGSSSHSTTVSGLSDGNSYTYYLRCEDGSGNSNSNDFPVSFSVDTPASTGPSVTSSSPSGTLSAGTSSATLSVNTDVASTCRYDTSSGIDYNSMSFSMGTTLSTTHSASESVSDGNSYTFYVRCQDSGNVAMDTDHVISFSVDVPSDTSAPVLSGGSPDGLLAAGTTSTIMLLSTDESSTCRYSSVPGIAYSSMGNTYGSTGNLLHSQSLSSLTDGTNYNYYSKCIDGSGNANNVDYLINFSVDTSSNNNNTNNTNNTDTTAPVIQSSGPNGELSESTNPVVLTVTTDEDSFCKADRDANTAYADMEFNFYEFGTSHTYNLSNLATNTNHTYYIKCQDIDNNANANDTQVSFSLGAIDNGGGNNGGGNNGGGSSGGGGSSSSSGGGSSSSRGGGGGGSYVAPVCVPSFERTAWDVCLNGEQSRNVVDRNNCLLDKVERRVCNVLNNELENKFLNARIIDLIKDEKKKRIYKTKFTASYNEMFKLPEAAEDDSFIVVDEETGEEYLGRLVDEREGEFYYSLERIDENTLGDLRIEGLVDPSVGEQLDSGFESVFRSTWFKTVIGVLSFLLFIGIIMWISFYMKRLHR